jgi:uncharacterized protein YunC (DUF1805 family)
LRLRLYGYNDHDNLDHGYIMIGYLDIDIKNTIYSNLRTPVNSVRVITCVHATPAVTAGGKRGETGKAPEVPTIRDAVDDDMEKKMTKAQDFKSSRNRPLHSRYD